MAGAGRGGRTAMQAQAEILALQNQLQATQSQLLDALAQVATIRASMEDLGVPHDLSARLGELESANAGAVTHADLAALNFATPAQVQAVHDLIPVAGATAAQLTAIDTQVKAVRDLIPAPGATAAQIADFTAQVQAVHDLIPPAGATVAQMAAITAQVQAVHDLIPAPGATPAQLATIATQMQSLYNLIPAPGATAQQLTDIAANLKVVRDLIPAAGATDQQLTAIQAQIDAVTALIPTAGATAAQLATIQGKIDAVVATIPAAGATAQQLAAIQVKIDTVTALIPAPGATPEQLAAVQQQVAALPTSVIVDQKIKAVRDLIPAPGATSEQLTAVQQQVAALPTKSAVDAQIAAVRALIPAPGATAQQLTDIGNQISAVQGLIPKFATVAPMAETKTAAVGTAIDVPRADHQHPRLTSVTMHTTNEVGLATILFSREFSSPPGSVFTAMESNTANSIPVFKVTEWTLKTGGTVKAELWTTANGSIVGCKVYCERPRNLPVLVTVNGILTAVTTGVNTALNQLTGYNPTQPATNLNFTCIAVASSTAA